MTFKTRRLKEQRQSSPWLTWSKKALSLVLVLRKPMMAWFKDYSEREVQRKKEEKRFKVLKKIFVVLGGALVVLLIVAGIVRALVSAHILSLGSVFSVAGKELPVDENGFTNILILGRGDKNHDGIDLTDSIMIVSLDPKKTKSAVLLSIPRDLYVTDPTLMTAGRVNTLYRDYKSYVAKTDGIPYSEAGPKALQALLQEIGAQFGVTLHHGLIVNFSAFTEIVDAMGGIDIVLPADLVDTEYPNATENGYETFSLSAGPQHLDGATALKYVRSRHSTSDFDRSARQQQVLHTLGEKAREAGWLKNPSKLLELWQIVSKNTETTMGLGELLGLAGMSENVKRENVLSFNLSDRIGGGLPPLPGGLLYTPPRDQFGGAAVLLPLSEPQYPVTYKSLQTFLKFLMMNRGFLLSHPDVAVQNAGSAPGTAGLLSYDLIRYGVMVSDTSNYPGDDMEQSVIMARSDTEKPLAEFLGNLLKMPVQVRMAESVSVAPDGTVTSAEQVAAAQVTILLGKDYQYTPLQNLIP